MSKRLFPAGTVATLAAALALLASTPASAYVRTLNKLKKPVKWADTCILLTVHTNNAPKALGAEGMLKAASLAGAIWGRPSYTCSPLTLTAVEERVQPAVVANDGVNRVMLLKDRWCRKTATDDGPCYARSTLAVTTLTAHADGTIVDADIEMNGVDFRWDDLVVRDQSDGQDMNSVLVHELGHLVGLDHNCYYPGSSFRGIDDAGHVAPECNTASYSVTSTVMFPSANSNGVVKRRLSADETRFVCEVYPAKPSVTPPVCGNGLTQESTSTVDEPEGGCSVAAGSSAAPGGGSAALVLLAVLGLGRGLLRRRGR